MKWLLMLSLLFLTGCFIDGKPGKVYFAVCWVNTPLGPTSFSDTDLPSTIVNKKYYLTTAGSYSFTTWTWDTNYYSQYYTLEANAGSRGSLFQDGTNGADNFYQLYLYGSAAGGPTLYIWSYPYEDSSWTGSSLQSFYIKNVNPDAETKKQVDLLNGQGKTQNSTTIIQAK
jgi:hypothetical protein